MGITKVSGFSNIHCDGSNGQPLFSYVYYTYMSKTDLKKEKWTLSFNPLLKRAVHREAQRHGIYPVQYLERLVIEKLNPFGHTDVHDATQYVHELRTHSRKATDEKLLQDIRAWQKNRS